MLQPRVASSQELAENALLGWSHQKTNKRPTKAKRVCSAFNLFLAQHTRQLQFGFRLLIRCFVCAHTAASAIMMWDITGQTNWDEQQLCQARLMVGMHTAGG